jgi:hypothetical protein
MEGNVTAYIITRGRLENLRKIIPRWIGQDIPVVLVVEHIEKGKHDRFLLNNGWERSVQTISPNLPNRGVGFARGVAVSHALEHRLRSIIMSDDDLRPASDSDMPKLLRSAERPNVLGIGAVRALHNHYSKGVTAENDGLIICPAGWGMQLFALNIRNTMLVGNFDPKLDCFGEDHELMRQGIATSGIPWLVHCGVKCEAIGVRFDPGGLNDYIASRPPVVVTASEAREQRENREQVCRAIIHDRWPKYCSRPDQRNRTAWSRMMDDWIPGWRLRSAMHGGSWDAR